MGNHKEIDWWVGFSFIFFLFIPLSAAILSVVIEQMLTRCCGFEEDDPLRDEEEEDFIGMNDLIVNSYMREISEASKASPPQETSPSRVRARRTKRSNQQQKVSPTGKQRTSQKQRTQPRPGRNLYEKRR